jgi:hypothetical protein
MWGTMGRPARFLPKENVMRRFFASAALWATFTLLAPFGPDPVFAASPAGATDTPEKTIPQGEDPPGADNGEPQIPPPAENKGVIPPPPTGDQGIYTQAPNPNAGSEEEVIPPPGTPGGDPNVEPR